MPTVSRVKALTSTPPDPAETVAALIEAIVVLVSMSAAMTAPMPTCPAPSTPPALVMPVDRCARTITAPPDANPLLTVEPAM